MRLSFAVYATFMAGHLFNILVTTSRLLFRRKNSYMWWDDLFSVATAAAGACLLIRLFIAAVNPKLPHYYWLELAITFLGVSFSRASVLMVPTRLVKKIPSINTQAWIIATTIIVVGGSYSILSTTLCTINPACNDTICACVPPKSLSVSAFIVETFSNALLLYHTWLIIGKQRSARWLVTTNIIMLVWDIVVLATFLTQSADEPHTVIYLINYSVILASLLTNLSIAIVAVGHIRAGDRAPNMLHSMIFVTSSYKGIEVNTFAIDELDVDDLMFIRRDRMAIADRHTATARQA